MGAEAEAVVNGDSQVFDRRGWYDGASGDRQFGGEAMGRRYLLWVIPVFTGSRESENEF
jgi:hypothetical protein